MFLRFIRFTLFLPLFLIISLEINAQFCSFATGSGDDSFIGEACLPNARKEWIIRFTFDNTVTSQPGWDENDVDFRINWGDGSPVINYGLTDTAPEIISFNTFTVGGGTVLVFELVIEHTYTAGNTDCAYEATANLKIGPTICTGFLEERTFEVWGTDEENGAVLSLDPSVPDGEVCVGTDFSITWTDNSTWNCIDPTLAVPNDETRWVRFVYGDAGTGNRIPNIFVGATQVTDNAGNLMSGAYIPPGADVGGDANGVIEIPEPVAGPTEISLPISMTSGDEEIGDRFAITLQNWNYCNPYDDGVGVPPVNGDNPPIETIAYITIIGPVDPTTSDNEYCEGDPIPALTVTNYPGAPTTVEWYNSAVGGSIVGTGVSFTPSSPGTYYAEYVDGCESKNRTPATLTENPLPTDVDVIVNRPNICYNENITISILGSQNGVSYQLRNDAGNIPVGSAITGNGFNRTLFSGPLTSTTTFNVLATNTTTGCDRELSDLLTINVNPDLGITAGVVDASVCIGSDIALTATPSGGSGSYSYQWAGPNGFSSTQQNPVISSATAAAAGSYSVTVTDAGFSPTVGTCSEVSNSVNVIMNTPPSDADIFGDATICQGASTDLSVSITGGAGPYTITIDNVGTINNYTSGSPIPVSPASTTTYTLTSVVDFNGCDGVLDNVTAVVIIGNPTDAVLSGDASLCIGDDTDLAVNITGGTGPYTINISDDQAGSPDLGTMNNYASGTPINTGALSATTVYTLNSVVDANGCSVLNISDDQAIVTVGQPVTGATLNVNDFCSGEDLIFSVTVSGGAPPYTVNYELDGTPAIVNNYTSGTGINLGVLAAAAYNIEIISVVDNCLSTINNPDVLKISTINPLPTANDQNPVVCSDVNGGNTATVDLTSLEVSIDGGAGNTITWFEDVGLSIPIATPSSYIVTHSVAVFAQVDDGTCTNVATVTYDVNARPPDAANPTDVIACTGDIATTAITVDNPGAPLTVDWYAVPSGGSVLAGGIGAVSFTPGIAGTYYAEIRNTSTSCTSLGRVAVTLTEDVLPTSADADFDDDPAMLETCTDQITLGATPADNGGKGTWSYNGLLFYEDFGTSANGTTIDNDQFGWSRDIGALTLDGDTHFEVRNNAFEARDLDALEVDWISSDVNISSVANFDISVDVAEEGNHEAPDHIEVYYQIDANPVQLVGSLNDDFSSPDGDFTTISGSFSTGGGTTLKIIITVQNNAGNEFIRFDNIIVRDQAAEVLTFTDINDEAATVSGLQVGTTTLTWTVSSALGVCSTTSETVDVTRNPLPVANDPLPVLCELVQGGGTVTGINLIADYQDAVTGIPGSTNRLVSWFTNAARTIAVPDPNNYTAVDGAVVYTRVENDVTGCTENGTVTFTVRDLPEAVDQTDQFCENALNSNEVDGIDLTSYDAAIIGSGSPADRTVDWYSDPAYTSSVPTPTNVTVNDGDTFYARVTDTSNPELCTNDAQIDFIIFPLPEDNPINGPSTQCVGSSIELYQIDPSVTAGSTYTWDIPSDFTLFAGGGTDDFFVLLSFPTVTTATISVTETSPDGCDGNIQSLTIEVVSSPPPLTVSGPNTVCEGETGVVYSVASLPSTSYAWTVPTGASIIGGQGTNEITVNFGTFGGNVSVVPTSTTGNCPGTPATMAVSVNVRPEIDPDLDNTVCSDDISGITFTDSGASSEPAVSYDITSISVDPGLVPGGANATVGTAQPATAILNDIYTNQTGGQLSVRYTVQPRSVDDCLGDSEIITLRIDPEPRLSANLDQEECSDEVSGINLAVATGSVPATSYNIISVNNGGLIPGGGNATIPQNGVAANYLANDTYTNITTAAVDVEYVIAPVSANGCIGDPPFTLRFTVNPEPVGSDETKPVVCSNGAFSFNPQDNVDLNNGLSSTFAWTAIYDPGIIGGVGAGTGNISETLRNQTGSQLNAVYTVTPTENTNGCQGETFVITVPIDPEPVGVDETKAAVCSDIVFNFDPQSNISNGLTSAFTWIAAYDAGLTGGAASGTGNIAETLTNLTGTTLNAVYTVTPTDNVTGCVGEVFTITVPINPEPDGTDETKAAVCSNVGFNFNPQANIANGRVSSFTWTASYDPGLTGGAGSGTGNLSETLVNTTSGVLEAEYTITPTDNINPACDGDDFVIIVPVNPEPVGTSDTKAAVCSGIAFDFDPQDNVDLNNGLTSNFTWTASYGPGITGGAGAGSGHVAETLTNLSGGTESAVYTIVPSADGTGCLGAAFTITVPIDPQPVAVDQTFTICSDAAGGNTATVDLTALNNSVNGGTANTVTWYSDVLLTVIIATPTAHTVTDGVPVYAEIDDGNCQNSASVTYTIDPLPSIIATVTSNYNGAHVSCSGASDGQITATPGDGTPTYQYSIDGGATYTASNVFNGLSAGTYIIRVRDAKGCEVDSSPIDIVDPTPVAANATVTSSYNGEDISCNGANDGEITVTASGGTGAYTYTLNEIPSNTTGATTGVFTGLAEGTYTVDVRDANNCFVTTAPITLNEPSDINAVAVVSSNYNGSDVSCTGVSDGEITVTAGGGVGTLAYVLIEIPSNTTGAASGIFTGLPQGSYTVRVTDGNNCQEVTAPVIISNPPSLSATASVTSNYNGSHISCNGANDAEITVTANGGTGAYSYELNEIPANTTGATTGVFTSIPPGTYTFNVRDANLCLVTTATVSAFQPVALNANATITSNYNGSPISCNGASDGQITISATGGTGSYNYVLNELPANTSGAASGIFTGVPAGTYTFNITDANSCLFVAGPITINEPNAINATAAVTSNYNGSDVSCNGATNAQVTVTATGGTGAFTYTLIENPANTSGIATGVFTGLGAGSYTFFIEDVNSCDFTTVPVVVVEPDPVTATPDITQAIDCFGNSTGEITVSATGGTGSYTFDLNEIPTNNTGLTTGVYTNLPAGTYTFDVLDVNGCTFITAPITIGEPTEIIAASTVTSNYNGTQISCAGADDGIIEVTATGGTGGYTYTFNEIPGNTSGVTSGVFTDIPPGTYTFNVEDANGCIVTTVPLSLTEPVPVAGTVSVTSNYNGEDVSCFGASDGEITVSASGGNGTYSYSLVGIPGNTTGAASGVFTGLAAGTYTVEIEDVNGCTATTAPITITQPDAVTASAASDISYNGFDISCFGTSDGRIRVNASDGVGPYSYVLDQIPTNISGASTGIFTGVPAGTYSVTVTDANGCTLTTGMVTLSQPAALSGSGSVTSDFNGADISCYLASDGEITVTASGGTGGGTYTYLLNENPANTSGASSGVFTGIRAGTYTFRITDANNCSFVTGPVTITEPDPIDLTIEVTSDYNGEHLRCSGASDAQIEVTSISGGTPVYSYELLDNLGTSYGTNSTGIFSGLAAGVYKVLATDVNGCSQESFPVVVIPPFPLSAGFISGTQNVCVGESPSEFTELSAPFGGINAYTYQWEESNDNFVSDVNDVPGANSATYTAPPMVTSGTIYYRRRVESGTCAPAYTNVITLTVNPLPTGASVTGPTDICEGDAFILEFNFPVGQAPFKFDYEDDKGNTYTDVFGASTTPVFVTFGEVTSTTTYTITRVEDINGCVDFPAGASWTVNVVNISAEFDIVGPSDGCSPATIEFEYDQISGIHYTWQWFDGTPDSSYTAAADVAGMRVQHVFANGSPNNTFNYNVFLTASVDIGGKQCIKQSSESVTVYPTVLPNVFTVNSPVCSGDEIQFTNSTAGATEQRWFYREKDNVGQELDVQTVQNASFTINNTGPNNPQVYEVVYTGSKNNGGEVCSASQVVEVEVYKEVVPDFSFSPSSPTFTAGSALVTFTNQSTPANDQTNFSYNWDFSDGITMTDTPDPGVINYTQPGIKSVKLTAVNKEAPGFCDVQIVKNVDIKDVPISIDFDVTPDKGCIPTTVTITNTTTGSANEFTWEVLDGNNQTVYENVQLADPDQPPLPEVTFDLFEAGAYSVRLTGRNTITNQTASVIRDSVIIIFPQPLASFDLRPDVIFLPDQPLRTFNFSNQADQYHWDFGDGGSSEEFEPEYLYSFEGTFNVILTAYTDHGDGVICSDTLSRQVVVQEGGATRIPNAFTPDINGPSGDGRIQNEVNNDIFLPITQGVEEFQMLIFDRWGSLIFESNDQTVGWDGYDKNGRLLPAGVYVYKLTLRLSNGSRTTRIGDVTLIR